MGLQALVFYGAVVGKRGDVDESMRVYLRLLVTYSDDKVVREAFSSLLANHADALDALREHLREDDASSGPAYAFLASIVKDYGGASETESGERVGRAVSSVDLSQASTLRPSCMPSRRASCLQIPTVC